MLTQEQVASFIEKTLSIPDWREQLEKSRFNFLLKLENRFQQVMHYENMTWGAKPMDKMTPPSIEEVIYHGLEAGGGACIQLNYFLRMLLEALGYDVFSAGCSTMTVEDEFAHIISIIRLPRSLPGVTSHPDNDTDHVLYMSDVGFARPAPGLINLNELPHSYKCGGFTIEHRYNAELKRYERFCIGGDPIKGKFKSPDEEYFESYFRAIPRKFEEFNGTMTKIFTDPKFCFFLNTTFLFRHTHVVDHDDFEYVSIRGRSVTTGNPTEFQTKKYETYDDLIPIIEKYFPKLNPATIRAAISSYKIRQAHYTSEIL